MRPAATPNRPARRPDPGARPGHGVQGPSGTPEPGPRSAQSGPTRHRPPSPSTAPYRRGTSSCPPRSFVSIRPRPARPPRSPLVTGPRRRGPRTRTRTDCGRATQEVETERGAHADAHGIGAVRTVEHHGAADNRPPSSSAFASTVSGARRSVTVTVPAAIVPSRPGAPVPHPLAGGLPVEEGWRVPRLFAERAVPEPRGWDGRRPRPRSGLMPGRGRGRDARRGAAGSWTLLLGFEGAVSPSPPGPCPSSPGRTSARTGWRGPRTPCR